LKALSVVIGQVSVTAVDARAHAATSSADRMLDRFVPRIRIPFTAASPRRVGARSGSLARERAAGSVRRAAYPRSIRPPPGVVAVVDTQHGSEMRYDLYAWQSPRDLGPDDAGALVEGWEAGGGDPSVSPFELSSDTGWFAREMARDAPGVELLTDSPRWDATGPIWLQTEPAPPARVVAMRLGSSTSAGDVDAILGLAAKYDLVLYDPRHGRVIQPLAAMAEQASATFWPRGAIQAGLAGVAGLGITVVAFIASIPVLSGVGIVVGGFLAAMSVLTFVAEGRAAARRRTSA
jgi:hypothetical protein